MLLKAHNEQDDLLIKGSLAENDNSVVAQWPCSTSVPILSFMIEAQVSKTSPPHRLCFYRGSSSDDICQEAALAGILDALEEFSGDVRVKGDAQRTLKTSLLAHNFLPGNSVSSSQRQQGWGRGWGVKVQGPAWSLRES